VGITNQGSVLAEVAGGGRSGGGGGERYGAWGLGGCGSFFIHTVGRGRTRCVTVSDASRRPGLCISVKLILL
jgi:hypothetical protein